ncbi:MAG: hypothetical protein HOZ81_40255 [Streptomyces sp.]|nr:hypothetical protein [Streptomyces sp.]
MIVHMSAAVAMAAMLGVSPVQPPIGRLPDTTAKVVSTMAGRPLQLSSYTGRKPGHPHQTWVWNPAKRAFSEIEGSTTISPDERWEATLLPDRTMHDRTGTVPTVRFTDRESGRTTKVALPVALDAKRDSRYHLRTGWPTWSPDGARLLVNVFEPGFQPRSAGIVLIDVPSLKARFVRIEKALITVGGFQWTRDSDGVVVRWGKNGRSAIRQYDLKGAVKRTWHVRGRPSGDALGTFSPSGRRFVTACTSLERAACVWETATGKAVARIQVAFSPTWGPVLGWYDERHLLAPVEKGFGVVDLKGKVVETLIEVGKGENIQVRFDARGER